ncbi:DUF2515 family protein [Metabacillus herbersteinensis]|uniref:DUF2515 family protein n=1 Tax=Metabacillus herbersteinensis TaxID=283816 RepID=A0ABV6GEN3_9BACI
MHNGKSKNLLWQPEAESLDLLTYIKNTTQLGNYDNISRTYAYKNYYERNLEIKWSFLASMVSRNAGWCMTDLQGTWFRKALSNEKRHLLFMTYEKANWRIFADAYPQLLIYEQSKKENKPLFSLLIHFHVSTFMVKEWQYFWEYQDKERLMIALIINEQNVIQKPIIENKFYIKKVFHSFPYFFQDEFHFSTVIFPTMRGELYGFSVYDFQNVTKRIQLGKRLAWLLFHPEYYDDFLLFSRIITHTGSRYDFEQYIPKKSKRETPFLRTTYPIVTHLLDEVQRDWFHGQSTTKWFRKEKKPDTYHITEWYKQKKKQLHLFTTIEEYWKNK